MKKCPDQLDLLTAADRERRHPGVELQPCAQVLGDVFEARPHFLEIENAVAQLRAAEDQVLLDRQRVDKLEVLMDKRDAGLFGIRRRAHRDTFAGDVNIAGIRSDHPTQHLD